MAINIYSKDSVDNLLADKLSDAPVDGSTYGRKDGAWEVVSGSGGLTINDLSNGATSTLNATAPTTGQALTFDGTDLVWATVGGGGSYLPLAGGAMDTDAVITIANATSDIRYGSDFIGLNLTASSGSTGATFDYAGISIFDGSNNINLQATQYLVQDATNSTTITPANVAMNDGTSSLSVSSTGITFPDSTTQSTAGISDAPSDGTTYGRKDGAWEAVGGGGSDPKKAIANLAAACFYQNSPYYYFNGGIAMAVAFSSKFMSGSSYQLGYGTAGTTPTVFSSISQSTNGSGDTIAATNVGYTSMTGLSIAYSDDSGSTWTYSDLSF